MVSIGGSHSSPIRKLGGPEELVKSIETTRPSLYSQDGFGFVGSSNEAPYTPSEFIASIRSIATSEDGKINLDMLTSTLAKGDVKSENGSCVGEYLKRARNGERIFFKARTIEPDLRSGNLFNTIKVTDEEGNQISLLEYIRKSDPELAELIEKNIQNQPYKYDAETAEMDLIYAMMLISDPILSFGALKNLIGHFNSEMAKAFLAKAISQADADAKEHVRQLARSGDKSAKDYAHILTSIAREIQGASIGGVSNEQHAEHSNSVIVEVHKEGVEGPIDKFYLEAEDCIPCNEENTRAQTATNDSVNVQESMSIAHEVDAELRGKRKEKEIAQEEDSIVAKNTTDFIKGQARLKQIMSLVSETLGRPIDRDGLRAIAEELKNKMANMDLKVDKLEQRSLHLNA